MRPRPIKGSEYWRRQRRRYTAIGFALIAFAFIAYVALVVGGLQIGQAALIYLGAALCFGSLLASAVMGGFARYATRRLHEEEFYEQHAPHKQQTNSGVVGYGISPKQISEQEDDK